MEAELKNLKIDRSRKRSDGPSPWAVRWIIIGIALFIALGAARFIFGKLNAATEVDIVRVRSPRLISAGGESEYRFRVPIMPQYLIAAAAAVHSLIRRIRLPFQPFDVAPPPQSQILNQRQHGPAISGERIFNRSRNRAFRLTLHETIGHKLTKLLREDFLRDRWHQLPQAREGWAPR